MERNCQPETPVVVPMPRRKCLRTAKINARAWLWPSTWAPTDQIGVGPGRLPATSLSSAFSRPDRRQVFPPVPSFLAEKKLATRVNLAVGSGAARVRRRREVWLPWWWCARRGTRDREGVAAPRTVARCGMCTCMYYYSLGDVPKTAARPASGSAPNSGSWLAQLPAASPVSRRVRGWVRLRLTRTDSMCRPCREHRIRPGPIDARLCTCRGAGFN